MSKEYEFIKTVADVAVNDWCKNKVMLPSVVIAQAILESGWGTSELAVKANALFGIKAREDWTGKIYTKDAAEQLTDGSYITVHNTLWRAYDSWTESILDHNDYIANRRIGGSLRYEKIIGNKDYKEVCHLLKECGYATSLKYPDNLINLINLYNLTQYDTDIKTEEVKSMVKIAIDAGHGLYTSGKQTPDGIKEWTLNDKVRDKAVELLRAYDVDIMFTDNNEGKTDESLASRLNKYKSAGVAAFVSIHHNAYTGKWNNATGVEVYTDNNPTKKDNELAKCIYNRLVNYTGLRGRGIKKCDFYVINQDTIPAVLVEGGFMDGTRDYKVITSEDGQTAYAKAVAEGLVEFLGLTKKSGGEAVTETERVLYKVQCGAFAIKANATNLKKKLETAGYGSIIVTSNKLYKVQCGAFSVKANAENLKKKLKAAGFEAVVVSGG